MSLAASSRRLRLAFVVAAVLMLGCTGVFAQGGAKEDMIHSTEVEPASGEVADSNHHGRGSGSEHVHGHDHADTGHERNAAESRNGGAEHDYEHEHAHAHDHDHEHAHAHEHEHDHDHTPEHAHAHDHADDHAHDHEHEHDHDHAHEHDHDHEDQGSHTHTHGGHKCQAELNRNLALEEQRPYVATAMTFVSGMAATVGGLVVVCLGRITQRVLGILLAFSSGVMLYVSFVDVLRHAETQLGHLDRSETYGLAKDEVEELELAKKSEAWLLSNLALFGGMALFAVFVKMVPEPDIGEHSHGEQQADSAGAESDRTASADEPKEDEAGQEDSAAASADASSEDAPLAAPVTESYDELMAMRVVELRERLRRRSAAVSGRKSELVDRLLELQAEESQPLSPSEPVEAEEESSESSAAEKQTGSDLVTGSEAAPRSITDELSAEHRRELMMTGLIAAVGIALHNLPEGLVVYTSTLAGVGCEGAADKDWYEYITQCLGRGLPITFAIALHNIPEGMAVALPILASTGSKWQAMKWCVVSSIFEPLAAVVFGYLFADSLTHFWLGVTNAAVAGIMIMLCLVELMPAALRSLSPMESAAWHGVGMGFMFFSLLFLVSAGAH